MFQMQQLICVILEFCLKYFLLTPNSNSNLEKKHVFKEYKFELYEIQLRQP